MAEFLIKATDATHPDPVKDACGCYKRGDIVVVMPDGHEWGRCEGPPNFVIVKVPDMPLEEAKQYIEKYEEDQQVTRVWKPEKWARANIDGIWGEFLSMPTVEVQGIDFVRLKGMAKVVVNRRKFSAMLDEIPAEAQVELKTFGKLLVDKESAKPFVKNKQTGQTGG